MSRGGVDTFDFVIKAWRLMYVTKRLFEINETTDLYMAWQLQSLLENFGLIHHVLIFVKGEGGNLVSMVATLCSVVNCELLNLPWVYMKVLIFIMCYLKHVNMLQMITNFLWIWGKCVWKIPKQVYKII
jgi:hypothetical protein